MSTSCVQAVATRQSHNRPHTHRSNRQLHIVQSCDDLSSQRESALICLSALVKHSPGSAYANAQACWVMWRAGGDGRPRLTAVIWCYLWHQIGLDMLQHSASVTWKPDLSTVSTFVSDSAASVLCKTCQRNCVFKREFDTVYNSKQELIALKTT